MSSVLNVTDGAGNTASANGAAITLDTTADGGGDLALSIGDTTINNAEKGAVAFTTSGIDGDAASATVTFSDGTHSVTVNASAGVADLSTLTDGPVSSVLNVTDGAGNTASANGATIVLDTTAPAINVHLANDTGSSSTDKITSNPTLTGTGDANAVVHFTVDGNAIATTAIADALGAWTFTPTGLANGTHTVVASETDAAGNSTSTSLTFALEDPPIEASGGTRLDQVANEFFLHDGAGNGPSLKYAGADVVAGQFGAWTPLGAEKVGERLPGGLEERQRRPVHRLEPRQQRQLDQSQTGVVSGSEYAFQSLETTFQQDLNARRHDRPEDDADRDVGRDAPGPGGQRVLPARRRRQRAVAEVRRCRRCRRPVRRPGRRSGRRRLAAATRWSGRTAVPTSTSSGTSTATATGPAANRRGVRFRVCVPVAGDDVPAGSQRATARPA